MENSLLDRRTAPGAAAGKGVREGKRENIVKARGLRKSYGKLRALDGVELNIATGSISGLIGPNGAGKTTVLKALLGLIDVQGDLEVAGMDPRAARHRLMDEVCFIADVGILPGWMTSRQLLDHVERVHFRFDRDRAEKLLATTEIPANKRIRALSKGMVTQLHLSVVMAIDASLLVLDEPTLGLDIMYRKTFYDRLLNDYYDGRRTIIISTHQVEEIEHLLTHLLFIDKGRIVLDLSLQAMAEHYVEVAVDPEQREAARRLGPMHSRELLGQLVCIYGGVARRQLEALGEARTPAVADLFVARLAGEKGRQSEGNQHES